jgi:23S rRNA pseudouridine1911/1915/1917 synthase
MPVRHIRMTVAPHEAGALTLSAFLERHLPVAFQQKFSSTSIRKILKVGAVHVNRRRVSNPNLALNVRDAIDFYLDPKQIDQPPETPQISESMIAYEDEEILVFDKPTGLPTQPTLDRSRDNLYTQVLELQRKRFGAKSYVGLHHRLDRDTSGLVLFTKQREVNKAVSELFKDKHITKTYEAIVEKENPSVPPLEKQFEVKSFIAKSSEKKGKRALFKSVRSGGDFAHTRFEVIQTSGVLVWLRCFPVTGRTHQIRIHCADLGYPIVGERLYGDKQRHSRLMLHAAALTFEHPSSKKSITVHSKVPSEFQNYFK